MLCLLDSAYILYKICEKQPDNRRQGKTGFRTDLVRLFGRKKETNMSATTTSNKMPMQTMPTAPSMSSLPQVRCLSTPVSVKRKTPTRQINIEEYANSSSETVEMPLDRTYSRVRLNEVPEVSHQKKGTPCPCLYPPGYNLLSKGGLFILS